MEDGPLDNSGLAAHNGPRLNAFLEEVETAAASLGGTPIDFNGVLS